jgi:AcrR family transcriptional regulator
VLFDAADRVLLRGGASALTSRAVTTEASVAKGVMHRHFADFDAFLTELVLDRAARLNIEAAALGDAAGTGTVADNLTGTLMAVFGPVAVAIVGLVISRDGLRARLRQAGAARIPLLAEGTAMISSYLAAERDLGRIVTDADVETLAPAMIGAAHLLFTDRASTPPNAVAVHKMVATILAGSA